MSYKQLSIEVKELSNSIIMDKCNSKEIPVRNVFICDMNNWIVERYESIADKNYIKKNLSNKGFSVCKKSEATHYLSVCKSGSDISEFNLWIKNSL